MPSPISSKGTQRVPLTKQASQPLEIVLIMKLITNASFKVLRLCALKNNSVLQFITDENYGCLNSL